MSLTPEQFNKLATKEDLKEMEERADNKFATKADVNLILNAVDGLSKNVVKFQQELPANQAAHDRIDETVNDQEVRIGKLEASAV